MTTASHTFGAARAHTQSWDLAAHSHWLLRIGFAAVFLFHGLGKLVDPAAFAAMMGLPLLVAILVALAEVGGGLAILGGGLVWRDWLTRLGGLVTIPVLIGAIAMVHWGQWSFVPSETHPMGGMEFQVVLLLMAIWFVATGDRRGH
jgi:putative oxidoreductase